MVKSNYLLEFNNATVIFDGVKILDSINLKIRQDENVAIMGPNGSGKSTLIKCITRDYYPLSDSPRGAVRIFNQDTWNVHELRLLMGLISSDYQAACHRDITGREMILSGFFSSIGIYSNHDVTPRMEKKTEQILQYLGIESFADKWMTHMSSGEERMILIAKALVHNPKTLILDEPTNSLDFKAFHQFRHQLMKITKSGKNIVLVTHNLADLIPEIKRVILIKDGKIFKDGPVEQIVTSENFSTLFSWPVRVVSKDGYYQLHYAANDK